MHIALTPQEVKAPTAATPTTIPVAIAIPAGPPVPPIAIDYSPANTPPFDAAVVTIPAAYIVPNSDPAAGPVAVNPSTDAVAVVMAGAAATPIPALAAPPNTVEDP